jgi:hypothetical protein
VILDGAEPLVLTPSSSCVYGEPAGDASVGVSVQPCEDLVQWVAGLDVDPPVRVIAPDDKVVQLRVLDPR